MNRISQPCSSSGRQIVGLLSLDLVHGVEHHHPFGDVARVAAELAALRVAAPDSKRRRLRHQ
jgi:hypothetical protein